MDKGIFIVIDGTDGSGKATQTRLLVDRMEREGLPIETISFPRYGTKNAGMVEEYLSGKYGSADEVQPKCASIFYAVDRFDASSQIREWLENGKNVIADRYVGSNMGHQGSKIADEAERRNFFEWAMDLEFGIFNIPRPDINIILHVTPQVTLDLMRGRELKSNLDRDIHESDPEHLFKSEKTYLQMAELYDEFELIECVENNKIMPVDAIHQKLWEIINKKFSLTR